MPSVIKHFYRAAAVVVLMLAALPVMATDYRCLNLCVNNGNPAPTCMKQCTPDVPQARTAPNIANSTTSTVTNHRILPGLQTIDDKTIITPPPPPKTRQSTDYQCLKQCLQAHIGYSSCSNSCTKVTAQNDEVIKEAKSPITSGNVMTDDMTPAPKQIKPVLQQPGDLQPFN